MWKWEPWTAPTDVRKIDSLPFSPSPFPSCCTTELHEMHDPLIPNCILFSFFACKTFHFNLAKKFSFVMRKIARIFCAAARAGSKKEFLVTFTTSQHTYLLTVKRISLLNRELVSPWMYHVTFNSTNYLVIDFRSYRRLAKNSWNAFTISEKENFEAQILIIKWLSKVLCSAKKSLQTVPGVKTFNLFIAGEKGNLLEKSFLGNF